MWKWTDDENIKAVILDLDSLAEEYITYPFEQDIPNIKVFEVSKYEIINQNNQHKQMEYFDTVDLLYAILKDSNFDSSELVAISSDSNFLKEMMKNHIGTIYAGNLDIDKLRNTPDFSNKNLNQVLSRKYLGYGAEVLASNDKKQRKILLQCHSDIKLQNGETRIMRLIFGGRYYPLSRKYFIDDPLSVIIRDFKNNYNQIADIYYDGVVFLLNKSTKVDFLTYVPLKPSDIAENKFNRFSSLKLNSCLKSGLVLEEIIKCNRDFSQKQYDAYHRSENVKGAFEVLSDIKDKTVVVLDDIYSTGATINEIGRILYEHGAKNVIAIFLAINQMTESISQQFRHIKCPNCESDMRLIVKNDSRLFFGCSNYPKCKGSMNCKEGLNHLKKINTLKVEDILDLEDTY